MNAHIGRQTGRRPCLFLLRQILLRQILLQLTLLLAAPALRADIIIGELSFDGTPPMASVLFVRDAEAHIAALRIDQKDRQFSSFMNAASAGAELVFSNSDTARHNLYANSFATGTRFNVGLVPPGETVSLKLDWAEDQIVRIGCSIHTHMETYVAHIRARHYTAINFRRWQEDDSTQDEYGSRRFVLTSRNSERFRLVDVPGEQQKLSLLTPYFDPLHFALAAGESKQLDVTRDGIRRGTLRIQRQAQEVP